MAQKNFKVNNGLTTPKTTFLYDDGNVANTRTVNVAASSSTTANYSLTLPVDDGTNGQVLTTDGSGILTWSSPAGTPSSIVNGNSNVVVNANANVTIASNGVANVVTITNGNLITGDGIGIVLTSNNGTDIRQVQLKTSTDAAYLANYSLTLPVNDGAAGQSLVTDGSGILSWESISTSTISNGNSNVNIPVANGNVNISVAGNANVLRVTGLGVFVTGFANLTDSLTASQATFISGDANGPASAFSKTQITFSDANFNYDQYIHTRHGDVSADSNAIDFYTNDGNSTGVFPANAILGLTVSNGKVGVNNLTPGSTLDVTGNANISGNANIGNVGATSIIANTFKTTANGNVIILSNNGTTTQQVTLQTSTDAAFTANYTLTLPINDGSSGQYLQTDGSGILTWSSVSTSSLVNGNSNIVVEANANVTISSAGNANIVVVTGTGANITGTLNVTANANLGNLGTNTAIITTGNITTVNTGLVQNGNSNIAITANANITLTAKSNATVVITDTGANITGTANITSDLATGGNLTVSGTGITSIAGNINMNGKWVGNIGYAVANTDAASKLYVDTLVSTGVSYHAPVNAATTTTLDTATSGTASYNEPGGAGNGIGAYISTTGTFTTIDGVTINGNTSIRILVKNEANGAWNGVYTYTNANAITRSTDTNQSGTGSTERLGINDYFFTQAGTVNNGTAFIVSAPAGTITFGTSNIQFSIFSTSPVYTGGTGITVSGTIISANANQSQVTTVGTLGNLSVTGNTTSGNFIGIFANGNSNISIPAANGNINISAAGNANIVVVTGTGANITGTLDVTANANVGNLGTNIANITTANVSTAIITTGNITTINSGLLQNGNSNVTITANANIAIASNGVANIVTVTDGNLITGNGIGFILTSNNGTGIRQVQLKTSTDAGFTSNYSLTLPTTDGDSGQYLQTDGSGVLSWSSISTSSIVNGNSNVVVNANANVTISSAGNANVVVVTGTDTLFGSNVQVGAVNANSGIVFNANTFQTKIFASNAAVANYSLYLPANVASSNGLSLVANTDGTLRFAALFTAQPTIKFTAAANGNNQTFANSSIANFNNVTAFSSVYRNGVLVDSSDYAFSDTTLTMNVQLVTGDTIAVAATNTTISDGAAGSNTQVQFNDAGAFAGDSGFTYNKTTDLLTIGNLAFGGGNGNITVAGNTWSFGNIANIPTISLAQGGGDTRITAPASNNITILTQNGGAAGGWSGIQLIDQGSVWIYTQNQTKNWEFANTGILNAPGNINAPALVNGNSSVAITSNANITLTSASNATMVITGTSANISGNLGVTGNISGNVNGFSIGYLNIPQVAASNTTLGLADAGKHYYSTASGNFTLNIPNNTSVGFATGTAISIVMQGTGNILVNANSGVTLYQSGNSTAANRVLGSYGVATLMKVATDTWFITGSPLT